MGAGPAGHDRARVSWFPRRGEAWCGEVGIGKVWVSRFGMLWLGVAV